MGAGRIQGFGSRYPRNTYKQFPYTSKILRECAEGRRLHSNCCSGRWEATAVTSCCPREMTKSCLRRSVKSGYARRRTNSITHECVHHVLRISLPHYLILDELLDFVSMSSIPQKLRGAAVALRYRLRGGDDPNATRIRRRQVLANKLWTGLPFIRCETRSLVL